MDIFQELGLCPPSKRVVKQSKKVVKPQSIQCEICKVAMKQLDDMLKDKATEAEITAAVEALCDYLPATYKAQVLSFST